MIRTGRCGKVRDYIRDHPGCSYQDIAQGIGIASNKWLRDVRKMVARGMVVCEERDGRRFLTLGREPLKQFYTNPEDALQAKREARRRYEATPERLARKASRARKARALVPKVSIPALRVAAMKDGPSVAPPPVIVAQSVDEWLAQGGKVERVLSSWERSAA